MTLILVTLKRVVFVKGERVVSYFHVLRVLQYMFENSSRTLKKFSRSLEQISRILKEVIRHLKD